MLGLDRGDERPTPEANRNIARRRRWRSDAVLAALRRGLEEEVTRHTRALDAIVYRSVVG